MAQSLTADTQILWEPAAAAAAAGFFLMLSKKKSGRHLGKFVHRAHAAHRPRVVAERYGEAKTQKSCERAHRKRVAREQQYENGARLLNVVVVKVVYEKVTADLFFLGYSVPLQIAADVPLPRVRQAIC